MSQPNKLLSCSKWVSVFRKVDDIVQYVSPDCIKGSSCWCSGNTQAVRDYRSPQFTLQGPNDKCPHRRTKVACSRQNVFFFLNLQYKVQSRNVSKHCKVRNGTDFCCFDRLKILLKSEAKMGSTAEQSKIYANMVRFRKPHKSMTKLPLNEGK